MTDQHEPSWIDAKTARERLGVSRHTLDTYIAKGVLPVHRATERGKRLFRAADVDSLVRLEQRVTPADEGESVRAFSVRGTVDGREATVIWIGPDHLEGDRAAVERAQLAELNRLELALPPTAGPMSANLHKPWPAMVTIMQFAFDPDCNPTITGDEPKSPWAHLPDDTAF